MIFLSSAQFLFPCGTRQPTFTFPHKSPLSFLVAFIDSLSPMVSWIKVLWSSTTKLLRCAACRKALRYQAWGLDGFWAKTKLLSAFFAALTHSETLKCHIHTRTDKHRAFCGRYQSLKLNWHLCAHLCILELSSQLRHVYRRCAKTISVLWRSRCAI